MPQTIPQEPKPLESPRLQGELSGSSSTTDLQDELLVLMRGLTEDSNLGLHDDIFDHGVDSLIAMRILIRLRKVYKLDLTFQELFDSRSAAGLAHVIEVIRTSGSHPPTNEVHAEFDRPLNRMDAAAPVGSMNGNGDIGDALALEREQPTYPVDADPVVSRDEALPPGIIQIHRGSSSQNFFWCDGLGLNLARSMETDHSFISAIVTKNDVASLGEDATLPQIAALLAAKIVQTQPQGPYKIGGFCLGGILAYEISHQLTTAGQAVDLLVLLDTPTVADIVGDKRMSPRLTQPIYLLRRVSALDRKGLMLRVKKLLGKLTGRPQITDTRGTAEPILEATRTYQPPHYAGQVLLILAADRPKHLDFAPGWQILIGDQLKVIEVNVHHDDLFHSYEIDEVGSAITSHF